MLIGALLFVAHGLLTEDTDVVVISPGLPRELSRRFEDVQGRPPGAAELSAALEAWKQDEVLYREALRDRLDRDDATVRQVLADRLRARFAMDVEREPSDAELERWLRAHAAKYELPLVYDFELFKQAKSEPEARERFERFERAMSGGAEPSSLSEPVVGARQPADVMSSALGPRLASAITALLAGAWQRVDDDEHFILARVKAVTGGLPSVADIRPRLLADWKMQREHEAVEHQLRQVMKRYRFEAP